MSPDEQTLLMIRGLVASLPAEDQAKVNAAAERIRAELKADEGALALALVGAEQAAKA